MKTRKLIARIKAFFDSDLRNDQQERESLKEVLDKLKKKELELRSRLASEQDPAAREKLETKINLVHSQRKKGVGLLKAACRPQQP